MRNIHSRLENSSANYYAQRKEALEAYYLSPEMLAFREGELLARALTPAQIESYAKNLQEHGGEQGAQSASKITSSVAYFIANKENAAFGIKPEDFSTESFVNLSQVAPLQAEQPAPQTPSAQSGTQTPPTNQPNGTVPTNPTASTTTSGTNINDLNIDATASYPKASVMDLLKNLGFNETTIAQLLNEAQESISGEDLTKLLSAIADPTGQNTSDTLITAEEVAAFSQRVAQQPPQQPAAP